MASCLYKYVPETDEESLCDSEEILELEKTVEVGRAKLRKILEKYSLEFILEERKYGESDCIIVPLSILNSPTAQYQQLRTEVLEAGILIHDFPDVGLIEFCVSKDVRLSKDKAIEYDRATYNVEYAVCTGDSYVDCEMLKACDAGVFPVTQQVTEAISKSGLDTAYFIPARTFIGRNIEFASWLLLDESITSGAKEDVKNF